MAKSRLDTEERSRARIDSRAEPEDGDLPPLAPSATRFKTNDDPRADAVEPLALPRAQPNVQAQPAQAPPPVPPVPHRATDRTDLQERLQLAEKRATAAEARARTAEKTAADAEERARDAEQRAEERQRLLDARDVRAETETDALPTDEIERPNPDELAAMVAAAVAESVLAERAERDRIVASLKEEHEAALRNAHPRETTELADAAVSAAKGPSPMATGPTRKVTAPIDLSELLVPASRRFPIPLPSFKIIVLGAMLIGGTIYRERLTQASVVLVNYPKTFTTKESLSRAVRFMNEEAATKKPPAPEELLSYLEKNAASSKGNAGRDSWGTPLRLDVSPLQYALRSAGLDKEFDTEDDLVEPLEAPERHADPLEP